MNNERKRKGKKQKYVLMLVALLAIITVGYAALSANLSINGTSKIKSNTWNIEIPDDDDVITCPSGETCTINPQKDDPSVDPETLEPDDGIATTENPNPNGAIIWMDGDTVYFKHLLTKPSDTFTFNVTFENTGSIDAKIAEGGIVTDLNATAKEFLTYTVTYANGNPVSVGDELAAGQTATFKVTVTYKPTVTELPTAEQLAAINGTDGKGAPTLFTVKYEQK